MHQGWRTLSCVQVCLIRTECEGYPPAAEICKCNDSLDAEEHFSFYDTVHAIALLQSCQSYAP
eukprot:4402818-Pyramimonas_sp.AAC.1